MAEETSTALERFAATMEKVREERISYDDLIGDIAPKPKKNEAPKKDSLPATISEEEKAALARLPDVYGSVVPTKRRALTDDESRLLLVERTTLDDIEKMATKRKASIKTAVLNHLDVEAEKHGDADEETPRGSDGHYVLKGEQVVPEEGKRWSREVRNNKPSLSAERLESLLHDEEALAELAEAGVVFDRETYLAMTEQTRIFDQEATMMLLRKRPELVAVLAKATNAGSQTASLYVRNAK